MNEKREAVTKSPERCTSKKTEVRTRLKRKEIKKKS